MSRPVIAQTEFTIPIGRLAPALHALREIARDYVPGRDRGDLLELRKLDLADAVIAAIDAEALSA